MTKSFAQLDLDSSLSKKDFDARESQLRKRLIHAQIALSDRPERVILEVNSFDRRAANRTLNALNKWLDPRHLFASSVGHNSLEEAMRPYFYQFWRRLPSRGKIGLFLNGWSFDAVRDRLFGHISDTTLLERAGNATRFEQLHASGGARIRKFWLHTPQHVLEERVARYASNPDDGWAVDEIDKYCVERLSSGLEIAESFITATDSEASPWSLIPAVDQNHYTYEVGVQLAELLEDVLGTSERASSRASSKNLPGVVGDAATLPDFAVPDHLSRVDLSAKLKKSEYRDALPLAQQRLHRLSRKARRAGIATMLVFEGWDAAGKGSAIRRVASALDAVDYSTHRISAPTEEELAHHYLWRFWQRVPSTGRITIFDRSWYGRVLVERIEGFADEHEWRRSYDEINDFEHQWTERGNVLRKFWIHIDQDEQLERFHEREEKPWKRYKLTPDDWRNRERWPEYAEAVNEMVHRTSTKDAPWSLIAGNNKRHARVTIIDAIADALEAQLTRAHQV